MATTNFIVGTVIQPEWLNDVDALVYQGVLPGDLTVTGTFIANGNVTLGNAVGDTITIGGVVHKTADGAWTIPLPSAGITLTLQALSGTLTRSLITGTLTATVNPRIEFEHTESSGLSRLVFTATGTAIGAIAVGTTTLMEFSANRNVTILAPGTGTALTVTGFAGAFPISLFTQPGAVEGVIDVLAIAGQRAGIRLAGNGVSTGTGSFDLYQTSAGIAELVNRANADFKVYTNSTVKQTTTADGRWFGSALHNNAGAVTGTTNQYVASGTYSPTFAGVTNVTGTPTINGTWKWIRVGNVVTVSGSVSVDPTATGFTVWTATLPIASNFTTVGDANGVVGTDTNTEAGGSIIAQIATDDVVMFFDSSTTTAHNATTHFTYEVK